MLNQSNTCIEKDVEIKVIYNYLPHRRVDLLVGDVIKSKDYSDEPRQQWLTYIGTCCDLLADINYDFLPIDYWTCFVLIDVPGMRTQDADNRSIIPIINALVNCCLVTADDGPHMRYAVTLRNRSRKKQTRIIVCDNVPGSPPISDFLRFIQHSDPRF